MLASTKIRKAVLVAFLAVGLSLTVVSESHSWFSGALTGVARANSCDPTNVGIQSGVYGHAKLPCLGTYNVCLEAKSQNSSWSSPTDCTGWFFNASQGGTYTSNQATCISGVFYRGAAALQGSTWIVAPSGGQNFC